MSEDMRALAYNDEARIREVLVGRRIVEVRKTKGPSASDVEYGTGWGSTGYDHIEFVLDDGTVLEAVESDGGCACSNGCFSVEQIDAAPDSVITNAEVIEEPGEYSSIEDVRNQHGEAIIRLFVYSEGLKAEVIRSEGGDNGYYGWGFGLFVKEPAND